MAFALRHATPPEAPRPIDRRCAVILNKNAKRVGARLKRRIEAQVPDVDVFYTESIEQARFVARRIVEEGYGTVMTGGGDGTVASTIDLVVGTAERLGVAPPRFGVLRLGTGNAVADFVGARHYLRDLKERHESPTRPLDLLNINGQRRATFAGFGWDAYILDNYTRMKDAAERFPLGRALFKSAAGYLIAGVGKSVPELMIKRPVWQVRVTNTDGIGRRLDLDGKVIERIAPGAVAFEGPVRLICFGTTPYYGFKFKIMPFAGTVPGLFHLRTYHLGPMTVVRQLRRAWTGRLRHPGINDLLLSGCRVEFLDEAPMQVSGDAAGVHRSVEVSCDPPIECLSPNA